MLTALGCLGYVAGRASLPVQKLNMAESAIMQLYVDTVNEEAIVEEGIRGMLKALDPHSSYTTAEETRDLNEPLQGSFSGVGITYNMNEDTLYVIQTVPGGPSYKVGILAGDRILAVNDTSIAGKKMKTRDIQKRLRGPKGTQVDVKVLRRQAGSVDTIDFRIVRDDIPIYSVDAAYMVDPKTGYVRLNKFGADTPKEFNDAVKKLKSQGMTQLILDLTDNGGGYLNASADILGELLEPGSLAVYTEGMQSPRYDILARPSKRYEPLFDDGRLVVMVNQYSASASEITAGAVQDHDRGLIVGRRSFGKGLVQRPIPFPDGSMMRLTVAHYYTPTGRDIQKPYTKGKQDEYAKDIVDRFNSGELMHEDSIKYIDSLKVTTLKNNRVIYGGGGISPDRFVALDTTAMTKYYRNLNAKGLLNRFVIGYVDENRKQIKKKYATDDAFIAGFTVTPEMLNELRELGRKEDVECDDEEFNLSIPLIEMNLKGLIGRDIFENATYYKAYNTWDPIFRAALELINSDDYDRILRGEK